MGGGRSPKRQRKKERRDAKREARMEARRRVRRQRLVAIVITVLVVLGGGAGAFFLATGGDDTDVAATPSPEATPGEEDLATPNPEIAACEPADYEPPEEQKETYEEPGDAGLDPSKEYTWRIETTCGQIDIRLAVDRAPQTTNSIAFLTREGFFNGLTFHRIAKGFVIQSGDPLGDGRGGPGYQVEEPPPEGITYDRGTVAMAKAGEEPAGTSGSQFFVVSGDAPFLPPDFAFVGEVTSGMDVVDSINNMVPDEHDGPPEQAVHVIAASILEA